MSKSRRAAAVALAIGLMIPLSAVAQEITVWRSPACGCCHLWAKRLEASGMSVKMIDADDLAKIKTERGMPSELASCHTAVVAGYAIEGHVPAREVKRLLAERPDAIGLAVPGMPAGAPGMDAKSSGPFDVLLVKKDGSTTIYARYP
ncbi:DUF411 domain-containing protein [Rhodoblastus sp.]|jgi:hypothetical protein|uniref:DUF411 domain-containing protein n=1 Tax=Rhodoblastus sp. TaxID=1962975 RepID=UPI0025CBF9E6|nr:DUF411 domain-containing protein [Rhodoblastus sp.]